MPYIEPSQTLNKANFIKQFKCFSILYKLMQDLGKKQMKLVGHDILFNACFTFFNKNNFALWLTKGPDISGGH